MDNDIIDIEYKKLENNIIYFESIIKNYNEIINLFESINNKAITEWQPWFAYGENKNQYGHIKHLLRKNINLIENNEEKQNSSFVIETLCDYMIICAKKYSKIYNISKEKVTFASQILKNDETTIGIYKYFENAHMGPHVDWNENNNYLEYTIVVYLNDDYEGGELYFNEFDIKLKPKAGSIVIYPSVFPYVHQSLQVLRGRKCLITHHWRNSEV